MPADGSSLPAPTLPYEKFQILIAKKIVHCNIFISHLPFYETIRLWTNRSSAPPIFFNQLKNNQKNA
jgi:hypothetical protein